MLFLLDATIIPIVLPIVGLIFLVCVVGCCVQGGCCAKDKEKGSAKNLELAYSAAYLYFPQRRNHLWLLANETTYLLPSYFHKMLTDCELTSSKLAWTLRCCVLVKATLWQISCPWSQAVVEMQCTSNIVNSEAGLNIS